MKKDGVSNEDGEINKTETKIETNKPAVASGEASTLGKRTAAENQTKLPISPTNQLSHKRPNAVPQHHFKLKAFALLRFPDRDVPLSTKEAYLGRNPTPS